MPSVTSRGRGRRTINEINMVPFIDVMLVLLIIFMVTAPLITPSMIDLPSVGQAARQPDRIIQIIVNKNDRLEVKSGDENHTVPLAELAATVQRAQSGGSDAGNSKASNTAVVISADKKVAYENVVQVMDALQRAGIQRVGLSVQTTH